MAAHWLVAGATRGIGLELARRLLARGERVTASARGMSGIAEQEGVTRPALYKALSETGDPQLSTLLGVVKALGLRLAVEPAANSIASP
jgi:probable addiction module antidote protein